MSKNQFQAMTRDYFTQLNRYNPSVIRDYSIRIIHEQIAGQCSWFLMRPENQFHLERAINNHAEAQQSLINFIENKQGLQCNCWYFLALQCIEMIDLLETKRVKTQNIPIMTLPHCKETKTIHEVAEMLGLFRFMG
jgi:hypothetical protein